MTSAAALRDLPRSHGSRVEIRKRLAKRTRLAPERSPGPRDGCVAEDRSLAFDRAAARRGCRGEGERRGMSAEGSPNAQSIHVSRTVSADRARNSETPRMCDPSVGDRCDAAAMSPAFADVSRRQYPQAVVCRSPMDRRAPSPWSSMSASVIDDGTRERLRDSPTDVRHGREDYIGLLIALSLALVLALRRRGQVP